MKISKKIKIGELIEKHPEAADLMMKHGMHCIGCPATLFESLEDGAKAHGVSDKNIDKMVEEINKKIAKKK
ncbi:MAG: DUF1858 domain-containing protein [Candidatus Aenigmarchaeota archaeon]|nr:DUF1858 domain-containing protein [Candidatus Aenigmarchaeota archaeon]